MRKQAGGPDDGQATTAFVLLGLAVMLMLVLKYMVPLSEAADHRQRGQTSAEAAALAGAQSIADHAIPHSLGLVTTPDDVDQLPDGVTSQLGRADADDLARANGDTLVDYDYDWRADEVTATVRPASTDQGELRPVSAVAKVGFDWRCHFEGIPTPTPTPTATPSTSPSETGPTTPPPPPPDQRVELVCGPVAVDYTWLGADGHVRLVQTSLDDLFDPRLVG